MINASGSYTVPRPGQWIALGVLVAITSGVIGGLLLSTTASCSDDAFGNHICDSVSGKHAWGVIIASAGSGVGTLLILLGVITIGVSQGIALADLRRPHR